jgi:hypothetical protein
MILSTLILVVSQTTVLSEDFNSNVVPPTGWQTINLNGAPSVGWISDSNGRAWHEDESGVGQCENILATPALDLSGLTEAYVHFTTTSQWVGYMAHTGTYGGNGVSSIDVSTDGGVTWQTVWTDNVQFDLDTQTAIADISAYAGQTNVMVGHHYSGDYAHEVWIDDFRVDDDPSSTTVPGTPFTVNLPTSFVSLPFTEDFSSGTVPSYMALTATDENGNPDPEAWCNISNGELQMGLDPNSTNYHDVRNACVIGVDGSTLSNLELDFDMSDFGEEDDALDGVWVSRDGQEWWPIVDGWSGSNNYRDLLMDSGGIFLGGNFYLMFGQDDNYPYADLDGVRIDNIVIDDGSSGSLSYTISNFVGGQDATLEVTGATPNGTITLGYSLTGAGPTNTQYGLVDMSLPIRVLVSLPANSQGNLTLVKPVPNAVGTTIYTQGVDMTTGALTNSLVETIQ